LKIKNILVVLAILLFTVVAGCEVIETAYNSGHYDGRIEQQREIEKGVTGL